MTDTPEQIADHIAQRVAAVGEDKGVRIIKQQANEIERLREALVECRDELDNYSQNEYPSDHPVHMRYRQRDYDANPARIALAALSLPKENAK